MSGSSSHSNFDLELGQITAFETPDSVEEAPKNYTKGQLWGALRKAWKAYKISKAEGNHLAMMKYANRIRKLQSELGLDLSKFAEVGLA